MGEEFVAVIKLVSGEEILASVCVDETGEEPIIIAHTPVTMKMINNGMYVKIKPWMDLIFIFGSSSADLRRKISFACS